MTRTGELRSVFPADEDTRRKAALVMEIIQGKLWVVGLLAVLPALRAASISPAVATRPV
jgi:hypothetical protein